MEHPPLVDDLIGFPAYATEVDKLILVTFSNSALLRLYNLSQSPYNCHRLQRHDELFLQVLKSNQIVLLMHPFQF